MRLKALALAAMLAASTTAYAFCTPGANGCNNSSTPVYGWVAQSLPTLDQAVTLLGTTPFPDSAKIVPEATLQCTTKKAASCSIVSRYVVVFKIVVAEQEPE